jgi:hypothetical protein
MLVEQIRPADEQFDSRSDRISKPSIGQPVRMERDAVEWEGIAIVYVPSHVRQRSAVTEFTE